MSNNFLPKIVAHIGYSEHAFCSDWIANPYLAAMNVNSLFAPLSCTKQNFVDVFQSMLLNTNLTGVVVALPHKSAVMEYLDVVSKRVKIAGVCNVVRRNSKGQLEGDLFDGEAFVQCLCSKGFQPQGKSALIVGCGDVGAAVAVALADNGIGKLRLYDGDGKQAGALLRRLVRNYLGLKVETASNDAEGMDLVVNATVLGGEDADDFPTDVKRLKRGMWVGEAVIKNRQTRFLAEAEQLGCRVQGGMDIVFEKLPLCFDYFGLLKTDAAKLRRFFTQYTSGDILMPVVPSENGMVLQRGMAMTQQKVLEEYQCVDKQDVLVIDKVSNHKGCKTKTKHKRSR